MKSVSVHVVIYWLLWSLCSNEIVLSEDLARNNVKSDKSNCNGPFCPENCIWSNSTHKIDLRALSYNTNNHYSFVRDQNDTRLFFLNLCRPLNQIRRKISKPCPSTAGVCVLNPDFSTLSLSLGQPLSSIYKDENDILSVVYTEGDICSSDPSQRYISKVKFKCNRDAVNGIPTFIKTVDNCIYLFEWSTSLVCDYELISQVNCIFRDPLTNLEADLTSVLNHYHVSRNASKDEVLLNICGNHSFVEDACKNSALCYSRTNKQPKISFGDLNSSSIKFDGKSLILSYTKGSSCHMDKLWSSELKISCSNISNNSEPLIKSQDNCKALIEMNHDSVCNLMVPHCTLREENNFFDLRILSSITHSWLAKDEKTNQSYYLNVCRNLNKNGVGKKDAALRCWNKDGNEICDQIGHVDTIQLSYDNSTSHLVLKYTDGSNNLCSSSAKASTKINFLCHQQHFLPRFLEKIETKDNCEFTFEWKTHFACPILVDYKEQKAELKDGIIIDAKNNFTIDLRAMFNQTFVTKSKNEDGTVYNYFFNLNVTSGDTQNCKNAAVCQKKLDGFSRDIGSAQTIRLFSKGNEYRMMLESTNHQKCGKNKNKNVTTLITLSCDIDAKIGSPLFEFESNNCDYVFTWSTSLICPDKFVYEHKNQSSAQTSNLIPTSSPVPEGSSSTTANTPTTNTTTNTSTNSETPLIKDVSSESPSNAEISNTTNVQSQLSPISPEEEKHGSSYMSLIRFLQLAVIVATLLLIFMILVNQEKR